MTGKIYFLSLQKKERHEEDADHVNGHHDIDDVLLHTGASPNAYIPSATAP